MWRMRLFSVLMMGVMFCLQAAASEEPARYVTADYRGCDGSTQTYDLADRPVKIYTVFGGMEYKLSSLRVLQRKEGTDLCEIHTVHGDHLFGQLITPRLMYYYFDAEKWMNIPEEGAFELHFSAAGDSTVDTQMFAKITLGDGSVLNIEPCSQNIKVLLSETKHTIPLSALNDVRFVRQTDADGQTVTDVQITYPHGVRVVGLLASSEGERLMVTDSFGTRRECPLEQLSLYEGIRCQSGDEEYTGPIADGAWMKADVEMSDGRSVPVHIPFSVYKVTRRQEEVYLFTTPDLASITVESEGDVAIETRSGDYVRGELDERVISVRPDGELNELLAVKLKSVKQVRFVNATVSRSSGAFLLDLDGARLLGIPSDGVLKMREMGTELDVSVNWRDVLWIMQEGTGWRLSAGEQNGLYEPVGKGVQWLTQCDGRIREFRWKAIQGISRSGVAMATNMGVEVLHQSESDTPNDTEKKVEEADRPDENGRGQSSGALLSHPRMKAGHVLQIGVLVNGEKEIDEPARRISSAGDLTLPLLGRVAVSGMTLDELSDQLTEKYKAFFRDPQVVIQYVVDDQQEAASPWGYVTVLGKVKHPGKVNIPPTQDLTVSAAIQIADGFDTSAKDTGIRVTRPERNGQPAQQFDVNLRSVGSRGEVQNDMILQPGDIVYVPEMLF